MIKLTPEKAPYYENVGAIKSYVAIITQTSTNAPVATELLNTLGEITWTRDSAGFYLAENEEIAKETTTIEVAQSDITSGTKVGLYGGINNIAGSAYVNTYNAAGSKADGLLLRNLIKITKWL